jgi:hypothetical protein
VASQVNEKTYSDTLLGYTDLFSKYRSHLELDHAEGIIALRDDYESRIRGIIRDGIVCGEFRQVNERLAAFTIHAFIERFLTWYSPRGKLKVTQISDVFVDFLINGIICDGRRTLGHQPMHPVLRPSKKGSRQ